MKKFNSSALSVLTLFLCLGYSSQTFGVGEEPESVTAAREDADDALVSAQASMDLGWFFAGNLDTAITDTRTDVNNSCTGQQRIDALAALNDAAGDLGRAEAHMEEGADKITEGDSSYSLADSAVTQCLWSLAATRYGVAKLKYNTVENIVDLLAMPDVDAGFSNVNIAQDIVIECEEEEEEE